MIREFINFVSDTMPCISPYTKEGIKIALEQFKYDEKKFCTTMHNQFEHLTQGDILENIPFYRSGSDGKIKVYVGRGIVLSNTCDCSRDENIIIAPFIPINGIGKDYKALICNTVYGYCYLVDKGFDDSVIDFSLANSFNREIILKGIELEKIIKNKSLNAYGYYMLICKLTVYLLRPEDKETNDKRIQSINVS